MLALTRTIGVAGTCCPPLHPVRLNNSLFLACQRFATRLLKLWRRAVCRFETNCDDLLMAQKVPKNHACALFSGLLIQIKASSSRK